MYKVFIDNLNIIKTEKKDWLKSPLKILLLVFDHRWVQERQITLKEFMIQEVFISLTLTSHNTL